MINYKTVEVNMLVVSNREAFNSKYSEVVTMITADGRTRLLEKLADLVMNYEKPLLPQTVKDIYVALIRQNPDLELLEKQIDVSIDPDGVKKSKSLQKRLTIMLDYIFIRQVKDASDRQNHTGKTQVKMADFTPISHSSLPKLIKKDTTDPEELKYIELARQRMQKGKLGVLYAVGGKATGFGNMAKANYVFREIDGDGQTYLAHKAQQICGLEMLNDVYVPGVPLVWQLENSAEIRKGVDIIYLLKAQLSVDELFFVSNNSGLNFDIDADNMLHVKKHDNSYSYAPIGHWDVKVILWGIQDTLKEMGVEDIFFSNIDNVGARISIEEYAVFLAEKAKAEAKGNTYAFLNEAAPRAQSDRKGGAFGIEKNASGKIALIEASMLRQEKDEDSEELQEIHTDKELHANTVVYNAFNPNTLIHTVAGYFESITTVDDLLAITPDRIDREGSKTWFAERAISSGFSKLRNNEEASLVAVPDDFFAPAKFIGEQIINQVWFGRYDPVTGEFTTIKPRAELPIHNLDKDVIPNETILKQMFPEGVDRFRVVDLEKLPDLQELKIWNLSVPNPYPNKHAKNRPFHNKELIFRQGQQGITLSGRILITAYDSSKIEITEGAILKDVHITVEPGGSLVIASGAIVTGKIVVQSGVHITIPLKP